ncbi:hypothetical protein SDD30_03240 [Moorella naiadis]|uniref:hypothetical protein n=1 Tax=Moorella naiadis (nom. illeg.) TaxID=3093670 RepID=UPI003D9CAECD
MFNKSRSFIRHPSIWFTCLILVLLLAWQGWAFATMNERITPDLKTALESQKYVNIKVVLPFSPEPFHMEKFHDMGTVIFANENSIMINRVKAKDVWSLAREYWITSIALNHQ